MFEVGFSEIVMIALVSLLVIGPERLPKAARMAGYWIGKAKRTMAAMKAEISQELHAEEMRQMLKDQQTQMQILQQTLDEKNADIVNMTKNGLNQLNKNIPTDNKPS